MVSDANAPRPLYKVDVSEWSDTDWETRKEEIAKSIYMPNNSFLHNAVKNVQTRVLYKNKEGRLMTFEDMRCENGAYLANATLPTPTDEYAKNFTAIGDSATNSYYHQLQDIFGLESPYEKMTLVFAHRTGDITSFVNARKGDDY